MEAKCSVRAVLSPEVADSSREAEIKEGSKAEIETKAAVEAEVAEVVAVATSALELQLAVTEDRNVMKMTMSM